MFDLVFGGSGNNGGAIDAFARRLESATTSLTASAVEEWEPLFKRELRRFHKEKRAVYSNEERQMTAIVCAFHRPSLRFGLWKLEFDELVRIGSEAKLAGWGHMLYENEVARLYTPQMKLTQAVFLALRVLTLAQLTSNYVREPFSFIIASKNGLLEIDPTKVKALEERAVQFNEKLDAMMLACPDITVRPDDFDRQLEAFTSSVKQLRQQYLDRAVKAVFPEAAALIAAMNNGRVDVFEDFPPGIAFTMMGDSSVRYSIRTPEEMAEGRWMFKVVEQQKEALERFKQLRQGRGEPLYSEVRQIILRGRPPL